MRASGVMLAHVLGEGAHEGGARGRLAGREQRARVLRADVVVQAVVVGQADDAAALADLGDLEAEVAVVGDRLLESRCVALRSPSCTSPP